MNEQEKKQADEDLQLNTAKGVYRGNWWSQYGYDPGDPSPEDWFTYLVAGIFIFLGIGYIFG